MHAWVTMTWAQEHGWGGLAFAVGRKTVAPPMHAKCAFGWNLMEPNAQPTLETKRKRK